MKIAGQRSAAAGFRSGAAIARDDHTEMAAQSPINLRYKCTSS